MNSSVGPCDSIEGSPNRMLMVTFVIQGCSEILMRKTRGPLRPTPVAAQK
jgi:hypothetical protein